MCSSQQRIHYVPRPPPFNSRTFPAASKKILPLLAVTPRSCCAFALATLIYSLSLDLPYLDGSSRLDETVFGLLLSVVFWGSVSAARPAAVFLLLSDTPLCRQIAFCLPICLLIDIWVIPLCYLLWTELPTGSILQVFCVSYLGWIPRNGCHCYFNSKWSPETQACWISDENSHFCPFCRAPREFGLVISQKWAKEGKEIPECHDTPIVTLWECRHRGWEAPYVFFLLKSEIWALNPKLYLLLFIEQMFYTDLYQLLRGNINVGAIPASHHRGALAGGLKT